MDTMKVVQVRAPGAEFEIVERPIPEPSQHEVLVKVEACGICHGDSLVKEGGHFPGLSHPRVPGHEVVGRVAAVGEAVQQWKPGQRVGVGWHGGHCCYCRSCRKGDFGTCATSLVTGLSMDGGYAEYLLAREEAMIAVPENLAAADIAPLLCAGNTVYGALVRGAAKGGEIVAIQGIGGLGHLGLQYAAKLGYRTIAISRGADKKALAHQFGAHDYIDASDGEAGKKLQAMGGAEVIVCTAPNGKAMTQLIPGLTRNGRMVIVSPSKDPMMLPTGMLLPNRSILASVGGKMEEAIQFSQLTGVHPMVETFPLERAAEAYDRMISSAVRFRSVLTMAT
jgi:D-arabinose 1-dehydrogenase-like Zn-dependent alcohol dehydrogenase